MALPNMPRASNIQDQLQALADYQLTASDSYASEYNRRSREAAGGGIGYTQMSSGKILNSLEEVQQAKAQAADLQSDPWGFYRSGFADQLAQSSGNDPSNIYRDKLAAMSTGNFGINDPSYKWRFEQGQQALERSQAAKGLLGSGNAAIELQDYGQGAASQEYGAQFNRMLQALSGVSQQYNTQQTRLMELAGVNLDPLGNRKVGAQEMGNAVSAQGNQLQAQSQANRLGFEQTQWQDQLNMNADYQSGLRQGMTPSPSSTPTYWG